MSAHFSTSIKSKLPVKAVIACAAFAALGFGNVHAAPEANALPTGGRVAAGSATISSTGGAAPVTTINQSSQRAVVDWNTFNVGQNSTVKFNQPNAQASTLNRVSDSNPSQIFGKIQSQGEVVLVNQAGVYFAPTASVDVGSIVATTHNISKDDYMAGKSSYDRNGSSGKVVNEGKIQSSINGYIALLAPEVRNSGVIIAKMGSVVLASGERITLNFDANKRISTITTTPSQIAALVENKMVVKAPGGLIILSAQAMNQLAGGVIQQSGKISTSASEKTTAGLSNQGGRIILDGGNVTVATTSKTVANGTNGGGSIEIKASNNIIAEAGSKIAANAKVAGNGGKVIIMSDKKTVVDGTITAQGGTQSGNGGFIETSSKEVLQLGKNLIVDAGARSSSGKSGAWLLDPFDLVLNSSAAQTISTALNSSNVRVEVNALGCSGFGSCVANGTGSLSLASDANIQKTSGQLTSLTLSATGNINIFGNILSQAGAPLDVFLEAGSQIYLDTNAQVQANKIEAKAQVIQVKGSLFSYGADINSSSPLIALLAGRINITGLLRANARNTPNSVAGKITIEGQDEVLIADAMIEANGGDGGEIKIISLNGSVNITESYIQTNGGQGRGGAISVAGLQQTTINAATLEATGQEQGGTILIGNDAENGTLPFSVYTSIDAQSIITASQLNSTNSKGGFVETSGQTISLLASINAGRGGMWLIDPTDILIDSTLASTIGSTSSDVTITTGGSSATVVSSGNGNIYVNSAINKSTGALTFSPSTADGGATYISANITTGGAQTYNGNVYINGSITLTTSNSDVIVTGSVLSGYYQILQIGTSLGGGSVSINGAPFTSSVSGLSYSAGTYTYAPSGSYSANYLLVGGGGGGGSNWGGGGGAGGFLTGSTILNSSHSIVIGSGGAGASAGNGSNGGNSIAFGVTAYGGGGGGAGGSAGLSGASGGGAGGISANNGGSATQGNVGGTSVANTGGSGGGGSGGAGSPGSTPSAGGNGGPGTVSEISGNSVTYAAGGGGAAGDTGTFAGANTGISGVPGAGGSSGAGGIGGTCNYGCNAPGANGVTPGSGGGGGSTNGGVGGNGASGIAILSGTVSASGSLTIASGTGAVALSGSSINLSSLEIKSSSTSSSIAANIGGSTAVTVNAPLSSGVLTLSGNNTYTGLTTLSWGYLYITSASNINSGAGGLTMSGGGLKTGADITISPAITLSATKNSILYATGSTTLTINGTISGAGNLTIANGATGTVVLGGANDYTGATNIYAKLKIANSTALSTSAINIGSSGVLDVAGYSIANAITITSSGGTIRSSVSGGVITGGVTLAGYYITLSAASAASLEVGTTAISGTGTTALTIGSSADTGSVTLSAANTYVGSTNVLKGTLNIANVAGLGASDAGTTIASTATLDLQNVAVLTEAITINGGTLATSTGTSSLSGAITLGAINNTFSVAGTQLTLSGVISGGNGFTKTGSGTLTLSNANTYTGATTISAGTLKVGNAAALGPSTGAGAVSITSGAVLDLNGQSLTNSGALTINGTGITLGGALINSSTTAASYSGLVALGAASSIVGGSGTIALTNVGTITGATFGLTLGGAQGGSIASIIGTTSGTVTKQDSGTWTLSGANTYTGATTVSAGTLAITNATGLGTTAAGTTIASGATLDLQNVVVLAEAITINGGTLATSTGTSSLSGAISLGATGSTFSVAGTQLTLSGVISGDYGFTKTGLGNLAISGTNTYKGETIINDGQIILENSQGLGSTDGGITINSSGILFIKNLDVLSKLLILNGGSLTAEGPAAGGSGQSSWSGDIILTADSSIRAGGTLTINGVISGSSGFEAEGEITEQVLGVLVLNNANTYSGTTTISDVNVKLGNPSALGSGDVVVNPGSTLDLNGQSPTSLGLLTLNGFGSTVSNGALTNSSSTPSSYAGLVSLADETLIVGDAGTIALTNVGTITGAYNLILDGAAGGSIASIIGTAVGSVTKDGAGTWVLSGANTYTGATTVNAGTLVITNAAGLGAVAAGTTIASGATLDLQGVDIGSEGLTIDGGTLKVSTGSSSVSGAITLSADSSIYVDTSSDLTLAGVISGTGGLTFSGGGTLSLDAANLFSGQTIVNDSLLIIRDSTALGSTSGGAVINGGSAELLLSPGLSVTGEDLTINGSFLSTQSGLGSSWSGNVSLTADSTISATGALEISGVISSTGAYGITKTGSGTLTLSNANTYTGATTISAGTLKVGNAAALGPSTGAGAVSITSGAVLDLNGQSLTNSGALTINGTGITLGGALINSSTTAASYSGLVALGAASSIVGGSGTIALTNVGTITGATFGLTLGGAQGGSIASIIGTTSGTVTKQDSGTWTLSGANTYTGATTVSAGTLAITNATGLGTTAAGTTIASGATLDLQNVVVLAEAITINGGTLATSTGTSSLSGAISLGATGSTFSVAGTQLTLSGVISGASRGITKEGSGILVLSNTNSYSGPTTINGGVLSVSTINSSGANSGIGSSADTANQLIIDGGTLRFTGSATTTNRLFTVGVNGATIEASGSGLLTFSNTGQIATVSGSSPVLTLSGNGSGSLAPYWSNPTSGTSALTKSGSSTWTITSGNTNSYSGITTVSGGVLSVSSLVNGGSNSGIGSSSNAASNLVIDGGTLKYTGSATGVSIDRLFTVGANGATLDSSGTGGTLTFSATGNLATITGTSPTLTLAGITSIAFKPKWTDPSGGVASLIKDGSNTVTVSALNTYSGSTTISNGTLQAGSATSFGTGDIAVASGAALDLYGQTMTSTGRLTINGAGVSTKGALTNSSGTAATYAGLLNLGSASSIGHTTVGVGAITLSNVGTIAGQFDLTLGGATGGTINSVIGTGAGGIIKNGSSTWTLSGANTYDGATTINAGTLNITNATGLGSTVGATTISSSATLKLGNISVGNENLTINGGELYSSGSTSSLSGNILLGANSTFNGASGNLTLSGNISSGGSAYGFSKAGVGTLVLSGDNTFSGVVSFSAASGSTLRLGSATALGNASKISISAMNVTLDVAGWETSRPIEFTNSGYLTSSTGTGGLISGDITTSSTTNSNIQAGSGAVLTISGVIKGSGTGTVVYGSNAYSAPYGVVLLSGSSPNTYSNASTIGASSSYPVTVKVGKSNPFGAGNITITSGSVLDLNSQALTSVGTLTLNGTGISSGGALINSGSSASFDGQLILGSAASIVGGSGAIAISNTTTSITGSGYSLTLGGTVGGSIASVIGTGSGPITKQGSGTWTLSGANTYTGATTVSAGTLAITNASGLGTTAAGTTIASGATLDLQGVAVGAEAITINGGTLATSTGTSSLSGAVSLGASGSTFSVAGTQLTLSGIISGGNGFTKTGSGTLILSASNTYTGATTVSAGTLAITNASGLGTTAAGTTIASGATLDLQGVAVGAEAITINGGTLATSTGTSSLSGAVSLGASGSTFSVAGTQLTLSGIISGGNGFTKTGSGTLILSGRNTYTGSTAISAGTLKASNAAALGPTTGAGAVSITTGAVLDLNGQSLTNSGTLTLNGTGIDLGGALINSSSTAATYSGLIALGAASSIVGDAGTIALTNSGTITGATFALTLGGAQGGSIASIIGTTTGTVTKEGAGTWSLAGANTYTGATTINAGTLSASSLANGGTASGIGQSTSDAANLVINGGTLKYTGSQITIDRLFTIGANGATLDNSSAGITFGNAGSLVVLGTSPTLTLTSSTMYSASLNSVLPDSSGGTLSILKNGTGAGAWVLSGSNTFTGTAIISSGTLVPGLSSLSNASLVRVDAGGILRLPDTATTLAPFLKAITLNGGILSGGNTGGKLYGINAPITLTADSRILMTGGTGLTLMSDAVISGSYGVTFNGVVGADTYASPINVNSVNTYTGTTTINYGTITINNANAFGNASSPILLGATSGTAPARLNGTGNITISRDITVQAGNSGAATVGSTGANSAVIFSGDIAMNKKVTLSGENSTGNSVNFTGVISGNFGVDVSGGTSASGNVQNGGIVTLSNTNTYSGITTVTNGLLKLGSNGAVNGSSSVTVNAANILDLNGYTLAKVLTLGVGAYLANTNTSNEGEVSGGIIVNTSANLSASANATLLITTNPIAETSGVASSITIGGGGRAGAVSIGVGGNTYTGGTSINITATLKVASNDALAGTGNISILSLGKLDVAGNAVSNAIVINSPATNQSLIYSSQGTGGTLTGGITLPASGAGTLALAAANGSTLTINTTQITGATTLTIGSGSNLGTVVLAGDAVTKSTTSYTGSTNVISGATLGLKFDGTPSFNSTYTGTGSIIIEPLTSGGTVSLGSTGSTLNLPVSLFNGVGGTRKFADGFTNITIGSGGAGNVSVTGAATFSDSVALVSGANVTINSGASISVSQASGNLVVAATGNFINNAGSNALVTTDSGSADRWIVYSASPVGNTFGGLVSGNKAYWGTTYSSYPPASVGAGKRYVFSNSPTITTTNAQKIYGDTIDISTNYSLSGTYQTSASTYGNVYLDVTSSDIFTTLPTISSAGEGSGASVGGYAITASAAAANAGYGFTYASTGNGTLTVDPRLITVTGTLTGSITKEYDGTDVATLTSANYSLSGFSAGEGATVTKTSGTYNNANAGSSKLVTVSLVSSDYLADSGTDLNNYSLPTSISGSIGQITKANAYVMIGSGQSSTYGSTPTINYTYYSTSTGTGGSSISAPAGLSGTATITNAPTATSNAATYTLIYASGLSSTNYTINPASSSVNYVVNPAILNLTISKTYNGDANFTKDNTYTISGTRYNSDSAPTITSGAATTSSSIAGTYTSFSSSSLALSNTNYTLVGGTISATINQKALTITANNNSKTYGDTLTFGSGSTAFTSSGLVNSETIGSVTITDTNSGGVNTTGVGGTYALTPSLATGGTFSASNYNITYTAGALTVSKATLTVTADNKARVYGDNNPTLTYSITGYVNSENATSASITGAPTISTTATAASNVNSYTITSVANNLAAANYQFSYADGTLTVNRRPVTVTADNQTRVYGEANPTLTYVVAADGTGTSRGMYNNQTLTGSVATAAVATTNVGDVLITQNSLTNANNANYDITYNNGTLTITPAVLTYNATAATSTYGSTPSVNAGSVTGWKNSETASTATTGTLLFSTTATGTSTVGTYAINGSGLTANNGNYTFTQATGNANALTINQKALTITSDAQSTTYGTALVLGTSAYTSSGLVNSDSITSVTLKQGTRTTVPATQSAGTYSGSTDGILASAAQGTGLSNYSITYAPGTLTINQKALTITANNDSKTYGDVKSYGSGSTAFTSSGLVNSETIGSVTITDTNSGGVNTAGVGGTYALTPSLATGGTFNSSNYTITYTAGTLTVNQKALTITASNDSKTYGDVKTYGSGSTAFTSSGLVNSETIGSVTITDTNSGGVSTAGVGGTYALTPSLATGGTFSASNYNITYTAGALTVSKATLTVTADNKARVYGDNNPTLTYSITGYVNSENATSASITGAPTISTTATAASNVNSYTITSVANNLAAANYQFSYADGTLTVNRRPVTVTADNQTRVYGEANPTLTYVVAADGTGTSRGMYNNQTLTGSVATAAVATTNVGDVLITQNSLTNANNANYDITYNNGTLTITPAVLTYNATAATSTYGSTPSVNAGSVTGWKNSETASTATTGTLLFSTTATGTSTVGTYAINGSGLTANNGNYTFTQATGNANALTINQKALTITSDAQSTTYGTALVLGTSAYTSSGLVNSDSITSVTLKQGTRTTVPATQSAGTYSGSTDGILASAAQGTGLSNYSITYAPGTLTINQKALTITSDAQSTTYGTALVLGTSAYTSSGLVNSDSITGVTLKQGTRTTVPATQSAGTYSGSTDGILASAAQGTGLSNYSITYVPGTMTVNKLGITLSGNVTYTGSSIVDGSGLTITNLVSGTTSTITGNIAIASADVGSQSIVNFGGLSLGNPNYTVTGASGSVNVTPAPLGISATGVYTGTTTISPTNYVLTGLVGSDINATLVSFVVNNKNVTSATRVTGVTLGGALASNYEINSSANSALGTTTTNTVSLTTAPLTITAVNDAKFVTQTDAQGSSSNCNPSPCVGGYAGLLVNGLLAGETIAVLSSSPTITRTNASVNSHGEYLGVLTPTGFSSSNYNIAYVAGDYTIVPADTLLVKVSAITATYGSSPNYSGKVTAQYLRSGNILVDLTPGISNADISVDDGAGTTANFTLRGLGATTSSSGNTKVGQYNIEAADTVVNGTNFGNNLVVTGSLKINPLTLTASTLVSGVSKTYDGNDRITNVPLSISGSGVLSNDVIGVTGLGNFSATSNVGSSLAVNIDLSLTGADKGNYALDTSTLIANIGQITQLNSVTYVGQSGGSWSDAANWAGGAIPTLSNVANVVIPSGVGVKYDYVSLGANAPAAGILFENNGSLIFDESSNYTLVNNISGGGSLIQSGAGTLTISGNNTFAGGIDITSRSLIAGSTNALGTGAVTSSGGTLGVSAGITLPRLTVNGPVNLSSDITTSGAQIYNGTVALGRTLTLDAGTSYVTFNDSVGHVGITYANYVAQHGSNNIYNLTVLANTVNINANITTFGTQTYGANNAPTNVVVGDNGTNGTVRTLISEDPAITFWGTINDATANTHDLMLRSVAYISNQTPTVSLNGDVGDIKPLKTLTVVTGLQETVGAPVFADISQTQYLGNISLAGNVTTLGNQEYTADQITVGTNLAADYTLTSVEGRVIFNTGAGANVAPTLAAGSSYRIIDTYTSNLSNQSSGSNGISSALVLSEINRFGIAANDVSIEYRKVGNGGSSMEITCVSYDETTGNCKLDD